jgi:malonyl CoA-acyl carrier protein transacylase
MTAFVFAGQGSQRAGMGQLLRHGFPGLVSPVLEAAAAQVDGLGELLRRGPEARLARTEYAQPAVTAVNLSAYAVLAAHDVRCDVVAGHSVGLLAALVAGGVLDPPAALRLAAARGAAMGALPSGGGMVSLTGLPPAAVGELAATAAGETGEVAVPAVVNGPETVVVSGQDRALTRVEELAVAAGATPARLRVSHGFHSPLMGPAVDAWRAVVDTERLRPATRPVLADTTGEPLTEPADLRDLLITQLTSAVRWDLVSERLLDLGHVDAVECGDSKVLRGLARAYPPARVTVLSTETLTHLRRYGRLPAQAVPVLEEMAR